MLMVVTEIGMGFNLGSVHSFCLKQTVLLPHPRGTVPLRGGDTASLCHTCLLIPALRMALSAKLRMNSSKSV